MQTPFDNDFKEIAEGMGISLYQRFSLSEASLFLRVSSAELRKLMKQGKLNFIELTGDKRDFFGYQLLEYLLASTTNNRPVSSMPKTPDRIIRAKELQDLTGLSRTTLWRMENKGDFPRRVSLGGNLVGWRYSEIREWIEQCQ